MLERLNPVQQEAAEMLATGATPQTVKDVLALSLPDFLAWRNEPVFNAEVARLKAARDPKASEPTETAEPDALETEVARQFSR